MSRNITTAELAAIVRVNASTVRRWVLSGVITPTLTTPGGHHRFDRDAALAQLGGKTS